MFPGMNPKKMQQAMKKLGIKQIEIEATEVIIRTTDKEITIKNPQVSKVNMMGQETYQVVGQAEERALSTQPEITEEDINTVAEQANVSKEEAETSIKNNAGDLAKAILDLKQ